jgi:DNA-binding NarL/FixJ family response regulator
MLISGGSKLNILLNFSLKHSPLTIEEKVSFRRKKTLELRSKGLTYGEISQKLQYSVSTIEKDIKFLRKLYGGILK